LQQYLKDKGHEAFLIKYDKSGSGSKGKKLSFFQTLRQYGRKLKQGLLSPEKTKGIDRGFDAFRESMLEFSPITYYSIDELRANPPEADVYISGSDQVWNYVFIGAYEPYFLQFGKPDVKRLSYAASFGHKNLPDDVKVKYVKNLRKLNAISVREES